MRTCGRDRAVRGVVHYTDAYTAYGPIRTEAAAGISYLTLRRDPTTGINYMPEEREKRRRLAGRGEHFTVRLGDLPSGQAGYAVVLDGALRHGDRVLPAGGAVFGEREAFVV